jgi:hypothetical protein
MLFERKVIRPAHYGSHLRHVEECKSSSADSQLGSSQCVDLVAKEEDYTLSAGRKERQGREVGFCYLIQCFPVSGTSGDSSLVHSTAYCSRRVQHNVVGFSSCVNRN